MFKFNHHFFHSQNKQHVEPLQLFVGTYTFLDTKTNKQHTFQITAQPQIIIDNTNLKGSVIGLTNRKLTFLDHYGYQLIIIRNDNQLSVYDEAEDETYPLTKLN